MSTDPRAIYEATATDLIATSEASRGTMFGMPCLKENGKAFAGFYEEAMVFKLGDPEHATALGLPGAHLFDPSGRRPMKEWVVVPAAHAANWPALARAARRHTVGSS